MSGAAIHRLVIDSFENDFIEPDLRNQEARDRHAMHDSDCPLGQGRCSVRTAG